MKLQHLKTIINIAETGSLSKAAEKYNIAQPALSYQIKLLEQELKTPLLSRHCRGVTFTDAGLTLLRHAREIVKKVDDIPKQIKQYSSLVTGQLNIGVSSNVYVSALAKAISQYSTKFPNVTVIIHSMEDKSNVENLTYQDMLSSQQIDIAFFYATPNHNTHIRQNKSTNYNKLVKKVLHKDDFYLIRKNNLQNHKNTAKLYDPEVPLTEVQKYPLILCNKTNNLRSFIDSKLHAENIYVSVTCETNDRHLQHELVEKNVGAAIVPFSFLCKTDPNTIIKQRISDDELYCLLMMGFHNHKNASKHVRSFIQTLEEVFSVE